MPGYTVTLPEQAERGIRVTCTDHDHTEEFSPAQRTVAFHCPDCGYEIELTVHDLHEWRDLHEMC